MPTTWNVGIMARPGATHVTTTDAGELDYHLIYRRTQSNSVWARE